MRGDLIYEGCVYIKVHKREDDKYVLFRNMEMDDPPMRKIWDAVENFILWPTEFPHHACVQL